MKKTKLFPLDNKSLNYEIASFLSKIDNKKGKNPVKVKKDLQKMMWKYVGVVRNARGMKKALNELEKFKKIKLKIPQNLKMNKKLIAALDVQNMLPICEMIIKSALLRKESRGAHYRSDYPKASQKWKKNIICIPNKKGIKLVILKIPKIPQEIAKFLKKKRKFSTQLLE